LRRDTARCFIDNDMARGTLLGFSRGVLFAYRLRAWQPAAARRPKELFQLR
jgi:hypothetical protein